MSHHRSGGYGPALLVLGTALLILLMGPIVAREVTFRHTQAQMIQATERLAGAKVLDELNQAYRDIATLVEPSVVHVSAEQEIPGQSGRTTLSTGSGWVWDDLGHIVTNYHVVENVRQIDVQFSSGELRDAEVVGADALTDIAVLRVTPGRLHPATRAPIDQPVQQGDLVFAFGSPFDFRFSMSSGVVSGKGRSVSVIRDRGGREGYENFIQVDAAINPGNSGGPLTDHHGQVIGMNTAIATGRRTALDEGQFAGIGLAIPLSMIDPVVTQIVESGFVTKGYLGVSVETLDPREARRIGFTGTGASVQRVEPNSPAAFAGVQREDIIVAIGRESIESQPQLRAVISSFEPGAKVDVHIWRPREGSDSGEMLTLMVELARLDSLMTQGIVPDNQSRDEIRPLGIERMATCTQALADQYGVPFHEGVMILRTVDGTAFSRTVEPGSIIVAIQDFPVRSTEEFVQMLQRFNLQRAPFGGPRAAFIAPDGRMSLVELRVQQ